MSTLPDFTRIGQVGLSVDSLDRASRFYRRIVGLEPGRRTDDREPGQRIDGRATFGAGERTLLELRAAPDEPPRPDDAAGLFHVAYRVPSRVALAAALGRIREYWWLAGASDHLVSEALYLDDPEDHGVEIYCDRPREGWERTPNGGILIDSLPLDTGDLAAEPNGASDGTVPPETDVGHVHLEVTDLDRARAFYVDALGFEETFRMQGALFAAAGGYHHHLGLNTWHGRSEPASGRGLDWFELLFPNRDSLEGALDRLDEAGYVPERTDDRVAVEDPDGIEVRLAVENGSE